MNNWIAVERKNFHPDVAAWEEYRIDEDLTKEQAEAIVFDRQDDRIMYAYIPCDHCLDNIAAMMFGKAYEESEKLVRKHIKLID